MVDLTTLRKESSNDFTKINQEFDRINKGSSSKDSSEDIRFWKLEPDKLGNATAVIRFLPRTTGDELPWVRIFSHGFQGPSGKWYIENSRTTLNEKDPVGELNSKLWASNLESNREIARKQKRRMHYISNVYIISDPKNPSNEGQVKLFKYGKKIFDKIMEKAKPTFADEKPINVFDVFSGADFRLRMRKVDGYANYDQSSFLEPNAFLGNDESRLTSTLAKAYSLSPFLATSQFKSYEDLNRRLNEVLETLPNSKSNGENKKPKSAENTNLSSAKKEEEDVLSYFQGIANDLES
jgi:hypothetical protein